MEINAVSSLFGPSRIAPLSASPSGTSEAATTDQAQTAPSEDTVSISPEAMRLAAQALILQSKYGLAAGLLEGLQTETIASQVTDLSSPLAESGAATDEMTRAEILSVYGQLAAVDSANALVAGAVGIEAPRSVASNPAAILTYAGTEMTRAEAYSAYSILNDFSYRTSLISAIA